MKMKIILDIITGILFIALLEYNPDSLRLYAATFFLIYMNLIATLFFDKNFRGVY